MTVFVDTSAVYALLDADDAHHEQSAKVWYELLDGDDRLVTTNYAVVECVALAQQRLGMAAVGVLLDDVLRVMEVVWIDPDIHARAVAAMLVAGRRKLSLVDCASFEVMRSAGIRSAFTLDRHFAEQGFERRP
ncbi:MAG TPA: PIN domain-containing protein [Thermoanaerobaculia bacterium]|jgi:predicted nucleic acid-binding protein